MRIFLILFILPIKLFSQDIAGVWTGTIYNDTTHKYIPYEIAITDSKGKLSGFSHTTFMDDNKEVIGVKIIKIKQKGSIVIIEDNGLIYNNYITPPEKGVKMYLTLNVTDSPSGECLIGAFITNQTKKYSSVTGTINLQKKQKIEETKIIPKLEELNLSNSLSFIKTKAKDESKEKEIIAIASSKKEGTPSQKQQQKDVTTVPLITNDLQPASQLKQQQKDLAVILPKPNAAFKDTEKTDPLIITIDPDTIDYKVDVVNTEDVSKNKKQKTEVVKNPPVLEKKTDLILQSQKQTTVVPPKKDVAITSLKNEKKTEPITQQKQTTVVQPKKDVTITPLKDEKTLQQPPLQKQQPTALVPKLVNKPDITPQSITKENSKASTPIKNEIVTVTKEKSKEPINTQVLKPVQNSATVLGTVVSSEDLAKRKIETIRTVNFKSDSLTLTLYDNGVVDGDTVTIILNGKVIMPKQGLSTRAITKTIYITPELGDSLQLIMYAENLGSIPPNTGLLIIQDGEERYQIRFAGDLQKNSAIILRRKFQ